MISAGQKHLNFSVQKSLGQGCLFKLGEDKGRHKSKLHLLEGWLQRLQRQSLLSWARKLRHGAESTRGWVIQTGHEENGSANLEELEGAEAAEPLSLKVFEAVKGKVMSEMTWWSCQLLLVQEAGPAALHRSLATSVLMSL